MPEDTGEYTTCRNCGKYIDKAAAFNTTYCSAACTQLYHVCSNCGKYYITGSRESLTCSVECAVIYKIKMAGEQPWIHLKEV